VKKARRAPRATAQPITRAVAANRWQWWLIGAVLFLTLAVYAQVAWSTFVTIDDPDYIAMNGYVRDGLNARDIAWAFTTLHASNWHPLTWLSHMLDATLFGPRAGLHHLTSLFLHLANTFLLFVVLRRMTGAIWKSAFVAALFALHPLHVESVAWLAERKDVLSTFFWMLTMLAYVYYAQQPRLRRYLLVVAAFVLGLMSKPMLVSLPIVLLLLDYWPLRRAAMGWKRLVIEKIPLFALSAASSVVTMIAQQRGGAVQNMSLFPLTVRVANALVAYTNYLAKMVVPINLTPLYPHPGATLPVYVVVISGALFVG